MSTKINGDTMSLESDDRVIVTAECCEHAAADGHGARIVSCHSGRLFTRNQAITAMVLAERLAAGFGDDQPFVIGWRESLACDGPARQDLAVAATAVVARCLGSPSRTWPHNSQVLANATGLGCNCSDGVLLTSRRTMSACRRRCP